MRLAKRVALVSQRRTILPSFSEHLLSTPQTRGFIGDTEMRHGTCLGTCLGYRNGTCFLSMKSSLSSSCEKAVYIMLKRVGHESPSNWLQALTLMLSSLMTLRNLFHRFVPLLLLLSYRDNKG